MCWFEMRKFVILVLLCIFLAFHLSEAKRKPRQSNKPITEDELPTEIQQTSLQALTKAFVDEHIARRAVASSQALDNLGLPSVSVTERGLVKGSHSYDSIIKHHNSFSKNIKHRAFTSGDTLGYVTPWNGRGYDIAKLFAAKFTYISPVWYQIKIQMYMAKEKRQYKVYLTGDHDADSQWIADVKKIGASDDESVRRSTRVVPRFIFEIGNEEWVSLLTSKKLQEALIKKLTTELEKKELDGAVLECVNAWVLTEMIAKQQQQKGGAGAEALKLRHKLNEFIKNVAIAFHGMKEKKELILVVPPPNDAHGYFNQKDFTFLHSYIDKFSLMTYDFSNANSPGPSSPLPWMSQMVHQLVGDEFINNAAVTAKILMGLNFYGMDFAKGKSRPVLGHEYIKYLNALHPSLKWNKEWHEHSFSYQDPLDNLEHTMFYPTLQSLSDRLDLARSLHVGLSIWEIGQGLDYFLDLF